MKAYWKNHPALRMVLMLVLFVLALVLVVSGWKMTGRWQGLASCLWAWYCCWLCWPFTMRPIRIKDKREVNYG